MSKIVVIGGTGYAGASIVREAAARGHAVTAISRNAPASPIAGVEYVQANAADAGTHVVGADVVVAAISPRGESAGRQFVYYAELAKAVQAAGARLVVIGGFSGTRPAEGAPRYIQTPNVPPQYLYEATEGYAILAMLLDWHAELDWLYVSPAGVYGSFAPGERKGAYRTSTDVSLFDAEGKSEIGEEDFATAVVDEIEKPTRHRSQIHFAY